MNGHIMKKNITAIFAAWAFGLSALASPSRVYINTGTITNPPVIDATAFVNSALFEAVIPYVGEEVAGGQNLDTETPTPYSTRDTLYYTNLDGGTMLGLPGFLFETVTAAGTKSASSFYNDGMILTVDTQTPPEFPNHGTTFFQSGTGVAYPSVVLILASNIFNGPNGSITVGADGLLQMYGKYITNNNSALVAGDLTGNDPYDLTSADQEAYVQEITPGVPTPTLNFFTAPPSFFDLWWGITNVTAAPGLLDLAAVAQGTIPTVPVTARAGGGALLTNFSGFTTYVYSNVVAATNVYYNIVCVNTNFANPNISAQVMFTHNYDGYFTGTGTLSTIITPATPDRNAMEAIVQFSEPCTDVISGQSETSSIYLLDAGAVFSNNVTMFTNAAWLGGYARPGYFEVSTATPSEWASAFTNNDPSDATNVANLIAGNGTYGTYTLTSTSPPGEAYTAAAYGVQVGWDPEMLSGEFPAQDFLVSVLGADIPDPTAEPARIDIEGSQVDLTGARIRAEGLVTLMATNLAGGALTGRDWGTANASIGATNGTLLISNLFPQSFTRLRGDVFAVSANWYLLQTNDFVTNNLAFHLLVVDQSLQGVFNPTVRNLALTGQKSIDVEDPIAVINQSLFETANLTINSVVHLTQNASSFVGTNVPLLKVLEVNTNGVLAVDNVLDLGLDPTQNQISPVNRQYTISGIGNFGQIESTTPLFQSAVFENDGGIITSSGGSMTIEADTLDMGLVLTNQANYMLVDGNLILSAVNIGITNSTIITGYANSSSGGSLTLQTTSDGQITDFVPNTPTTSSVVNNFWQVTDGFNLPVKPATGDLFGTQITTIATGTTVAQHIWAGRGDYTNAVDGFVNNMVIGRLILSRQSAGAELHFSGAGTQNGLYVDYLELDPNSLSYSDYRNGLVIDPNLTIYFADSNVDPFKLATVYTNRLVWVTDFWGPNSTRFVTNEFDTNQFCAVNAAVADNNSDPAVSFFPGTNAQGYTNFNADNQPYVLNNPTNGAWLYTNGECPAVMLTIESSSKFINQTFASVKGTYNGLFYDTNEPSSANSGFFTFTLSPSGAFSGRLLMGPASYTFSGSGTNKFKTSGAARATAKHGNQSLTVNLQLVDTADGTTGQVQGDVNGGTWDAPLLGDLKPVWTAKHPSPYAGRYTMVLTNGGTNSVPGGDSYGSLTVSKLGVLSVAGKLADGNAFSQSVPIAQDGFWPFYTYVAGGGDFLLGWIAFQSSDSGWAALQGSEATGVAIGETNLFWSKAPSFKARYYPAGFTNTYNLAGSSYVFPGKNSSGLALTNPVVILSGDGLVGMTNPVVYNGKLMYTNSYLTLSINPTLGTFTGRLQYPGDGTSIRMDGVVLQNQYGAFGFFPGINNETGAVLLQSQ